MGIARHAGCSPLLLTAIFGLIAAAGCSAPSPRSGPSDALAGPARLRVLGIAQDGGVPHVACRCDRCTAARSDEARRHAVASLALILPRGIGSSPAVYLIDATPDLPRQLEQLGDVRDAPSDRVDRQPVDGVLLTHAHLGHYLGLAYFGFEAVHTHGLPVWCSPRMAEFLRTHGPWSQLVELRNIELRPIRPEIPFVVEEDGVRISAHLVPHRDELSDTLAFCVRGPKRTVLYLPDTEPWDRWSAPLPDLLDRLGVDVLLVDGTFYSPDELPGRPASSIGHPLVTSTIELLSERVASGRLSVWFTHLNHSNPLLTSGSSARRDVEANGMSVAYEGLEIALE